MKGKTLHKCLTPKGDVPNKKRRWIKMSYKTVIPEAKNGLNKFKMETASQLGVTFTDYNGNLTSKQCGSVGGEMVKKMIEQYEKTL
jgi:small acid-soluble spore protein D (minor alpha/beta-type SASP)